MHKLKLSFVGGFFLILVLLAQPAAARRSPPRAAPGTATHHGASNSHIVGIAHFAYYVTNLRRARSYYQDFLGFDQAFTVKNAQGRIRAAYFKVNRRQYIILYPRYPGMKPHYGWMHDAGFESDHIRQSHAFVARLGVRSLTPIRKDPAGDREFSFLDPSGFTIEVIQYLPHSRTGKTAGRFDSPRRIGTWIDHIGLLQKSRRQAARFYRAFLDSSSGVVGHKLTIARGPDRFEIGWQRKRPAPIRFHIKDHVCISVQNVPATVSRLEALDIYRQFRPIETHQLSNGKHVAELYDPDGNRVELMEPTGSSQAAQAAPTKKNGYEVLTHLPSGHHALLERMTKAFGLSYPQELLFEPRLHAEEAVSQPLLRFPAFTPGQKKTVMLELKLAARRNLLPLMTPRQRPLLERDIEMLARTGKEPLERRHGKRRRQHSKKGRPGRKGNHHRHGRKVKKRRKKVLPLLPLAQGEPLLSHAIRHYRAFTPQQKRALLLKVKQAALRHADTLPLNLRRKLRREVRQLQAEP